MPCMVTRLEKARCGIDYSIVIVIISSGMVKGSAKSSATSATRKKHARKHAPPEDVSQSVKDTKTLKGGKSQSGKGGKKNKEPRVKMYIPPVKPVPVQPDPLETTGLANSLPADLLVVLRSLSKKAQVTKVRALEELQTAWVDRCIREKDEVLSHTLIEMLPVWVSLYLYVCWGEVERDISASPFSGTAS